MELNKLNQRLDMNIETKTRSSNKYKQTNRKIIMTSYEYVFFLITSIFIFDQIGKM